MPATRTGTMVPGKPETMTVEIDTDLSDKEYYLVNFDGTDERVVNIAAGATEIPYPLLTGGNGSSTTIYDGVIAIGGYTKVILGGTVVSGDFLTSDANGKAVATTTDTNISGLTSLEAGVAGDVIAVKVSPATIAG